MNNDLNKLNTISSSKYDIYGKLLDLAASGEYITKLDNFENIDFLKSGLFGYITESLAMLMRDSSFHKTMIYRENFLNTAIMPKSIYNWAKMFNVNVIDAVPSSRKATISLNINTIDSIIRNTTSSIESYKKKYGIVENGNFMVIDKSNPIIAGSYYFMLEHSIEIYKNSNGQYIIKYCLNEEEKTTEFGSYSNGGIITTVRKPVGNTTYLYFDVTVFQYKVVEKSKIISGSTFLDTKVHQFDISGQLCGLSLSYQKGNDTEEVLLKFSNIELSDDTTQNKKIAYYSIVDDHLLEISFLTNNTSGLPQSGGTLKLKTFITEGFNGNINFTGEAVFLIKQDDIKSLPISISLSSSPTSAGLDQTALGEIKGSIINKLATRNTIITENDLNSWFASQSKFLENVNNSEITFRKEVDNLLRRTFSAYLLLRDGVSLSEYLTMQTTSGEGSVSGESSDASLPTEVPSSYISNVVPTNTIDLTINVDDISRTDDNIRIDYNNNISYNPETGTYNYEPTSSMTGEKCLYKTPFVIYLNRQYNILSYYYLETLDSTELEYMDLANQSNNILLIPVSMEVFHQNTTASNSGSGITESPYEFKFYFTSDIDLTTISIDKAALTFGTSTINIPSNADNCYFSLVESSEESDSGIHNYVLNIKTVTTSGQALEMKTDTVNPQIVLNFGKNSKDEDLSVAVYENTPLKLDLVLGDNSFSGTFKTVKDISIFKSLNDVMSSDIIMNKTGEGENEKFVGYTIKDIPVVASYWLDAKSINKKWFIKQLFVFINMLKTNLNKLETTTFFNIKFRNTYGISQYLTSTNTMLRLKLKIFLKSDTIDQYKNNLTTGYNTTDSLKKEIIDFIRVAVDRSNKDKALVISKIIMQTQAAYINFIDHIDFLGLNGTFNQYIENIEEKISNKTYPLEYFSLDNTIENEDGVSLSRLEKDITFEII